MTAPSPQWLAHQIVAHASEAVLFADRDGTVRLWNAGAERMFGWTAAEMVGKSMDPIIPDRLRQRHWDGWTETMRTGVTKYAGADLLAVPALHKDGRTLSVEFSIQLVRDDSGVLLGPVAIFRDVTARFQRDKELRQRVKELEARLASMPPAKG